MPRVLTEWTGAILLIAAICTLLLPKLKSRKLHTKKKKTKEKRQENTVKQFSEFPRLWFGSLKICLAQRSNYKGLDSGERERKEERREEKRNER